jgi:membrane protease YdiL (CAAX protease family)
MTPVDVTPTPNRPSPNPFFDYSDFFFFLVLAVPSVFIALMLVRVAKVFLPIPMAVQLLLVQSVWYFLAFGALAALFRIRYDRPLWQSLGWRPIAFGGAATAILAGPLLAFSIGLLGSALRTPEIDLPFEQMLSSRATVIFLGVLVVILGPVAEELAFRGFLMPLLVRNIGAAGGIVATGVIFGGIHGYEYQWSWRHIVLISGAGCVFGWAKYKTQSTLASALMHSTFNLTQFAAFLIEARRL